jgi:hypothetical protein
MTLLLKDLAPVALTRYWKAPSMTIGGPDACRARLRGGDVTKSCSPMAIEIGERIGIGRVWV